MFRYGLLFEALQKALDGNRPITDESSAIEAMGKRPLLVRGHISNIKITGPDDICVSYAESLLHHVAT